VSTLDELTGWRDLVKLMGQAKANWIRRAEEKAFKATEADIELQKSRLADLRSLYRYLTAQVKAMGEADGQ